MFLTIPELLDLVGNFIEFQDLDSFCLTHRAAVRPARRRLFRSIRIFAPSRDPMRPSKHDNVVQRPELAVHVRKLEIVGFTIGVYHDRCPLDYVVDMLKACPGTRSLLLNNIKWVRNLLIDDDLLKTSVGANLEELDLTGITCATGTPMELLWLRADWIRVSFTWCDLRILATDRVRPSGRKHVRSRSLFVGHQVENRFKNALNESGKGIISGVDDLTVVYDSRDTQNIAFLIASKNKYPCLTSLTIRDRWHNDAQTTPNDLNNSALAYEISRCENLRRFELNICYLPNPTLAETRTQYREIGRLLTAVPADVPCVQLHINVLNREWTMPAQRYMLLQIAWRRLARPLLSRLRATTDTILVTLRLPDLPRDWLEGEFLTALLPAFTPFDTGTAVFSDDSSGLRLTCT